MGGDSAVFAQMIIDSSWNIGFYLAAFLVLIVVIVFVHEFGHYIVGRWCGVGVDAFSVGFGKELFGFTDKRGTRWKFCAIPLGGYVKFEGDANAASQPDETVHTATSLHAQPLWQRASIVAAGPIANFLLAIAIMTPVLWLAGKPYYPPIVQGFSEGSAAQAAGVQAGDRILSIDGTAIYDYDDIKRLVSLRAGDALAVVVQRGSEEIAVTVTPKETSVDDGIGGKVKIGLLGVSYKAANGEVEMQRFSLGGALVQATWDTKNQVISILQGVKSLIVGKQSLSQVGGAVSIAKMAGASASYGLITFVTFLAAISVYIGLINLFPIPILDGGHLALFAIEAVLGKPLDGRALEWSYRIGLGLVLVLLALGQFNDVTRHFGFGT